MNNKGQALLEFVLILPIFLLILLSIIDFGNIYSNKIELENNSKDIILMLNNNSSINEINNIYNKIDISKEKYNEKYYKVVISKKINLNTPILSKILKSPYEIKIERVIPYE